MTRGVNKLKEMGLQEEAIVKALTYNACVLGEDSKAVKALVGEVDKLISAAKTYFGANGADVTAGSVAATWLERARDTTVAAFTTVATQDSIMRERAYPDVFAPTTASEDKTPSGIALLSSGSV